jgi:uncharacterized protein
MIIGCDIDGVLADFNASFIQRVIDVTGVDLFPSRPFNIPTWNYPEHYGYTPDEVSAVWRSIKADCGFWEWLPPYPSTPSAIEHLEERRYDYGDDIYYVTARPGIDAKAQTERWLMNHGVRRPTVLISSRKGDVCSALNIDAYVDDRWENAVDVAKTATKSFLLVRPWNQDTKPRAFGITPVMSVGDFLTF